MKKKYPLLAPSQNTLFADSNMITAKLPFSKTYLTNNLQVRMLDFLGLRLRGSSNGGESGDVQAFAQCHSSALGFMIIVKKAPACVGQAFLRGLWKQAMC